jgi:hypothetical protein
MKFPPRKKSSGVHRKHFPHAFFFTWKNIEMNFFVHWPRAAGSSDVVRCNSSPKRCCKPHLCSRTNHVTTRWSSLSLSVSLSLSLSHSLSVCLALALSLSFSVCHSERVINVSVQEWRRRCIDLDIGRFVCHNSIQQPLQQQQQHQQQHFTLSTLSLSHTHTHNHFQSYTSLELKPTFSKHSDFFLVFFGGRATRRPDEFVKKNRPKCSPAQFCQN